MKQTNKDYTILALLIPFSIAILFELSIHFITF
jgi:hypothetical protein